MKHFIILCLAFLSACCPSPSHPKVQPLKDVSVSLVVADTEDGSYRSFCSGTMVAPRKILSCAHCVVGLANHLDVGDPTNVVVHYILAKNEPYDMGGEPTTVSLAKVDRIDEDHDLALLSTFEDNQYATIAFERPALLEPIIFVGTPRGLWFTVSLGYLSAVRMSIEESGKTGPWLQMGQTGVYYGSSGGGAFNKHGELVGVVSMLPHGVPGSVLCVDVMTIKSFLKGE